MQTIGLIALAVFAGGLAISWIIGRRFNEKRGAELSLFVQLMVYGVAAAYVIRGAAHAADRGGAFLWLAAFLAFLSAVMVLLGLLRVTALFLSVTGRLPPDT